MTFASLPVLVPLLTQVPMLGMLAGCGIQANYLDGSLVQAYEVQFDETRIRLYDSELSVEYVDNLTQTGIVSIRITVPNSDRLGPRSTLNLAQVGAVVRGEGYESPLPTLDSGTFKLKQYGEQRGADVVGSFRAVFLTPEGSKLTLRGGFSAPMERVEDL